jgi:hypothetical protein
MSKRNLWLIGTAAAILLAAMVVGPTVLAKDKDLELSVVPGNFPPQGIDHLMVRIAPEYLGGHATLFATIEGEPHAMEIFQFELDSTNLPIVVPRLAPPEMAITYQYEATYPDGTLAGMSELAVSDPFEPAEGWE